MDPKWTENDADALAEAQHIWDSIEAGDAMPAVEALGDGLIVENGPGAGPWRHTEGTNEFLTMLLEFSSQFGETFQQSGAVLFANDQLNVILVSETGVHAESGDVFDNRAIYVNRLGPDGQVDRLWTVDLDCEDMDAFWARNPVDG